MKNSFESSDQEHLETVVRTLESRVSKLIGDKLKLQEELMRMVLKNDELTEELRQLRSKITRVKLEGVVS